MTALVAAVLVAVAIAGAASLVGRRSAGGSLGACLVGQLVAMLVRLAGLAGTAILVHLCWPGDLLLALCVAVGVVLAGLALDVRVLLRTVRIPTEERVRA